MKKVLAFVVTVLVLGSTSGFAADKKSEKAKAYPLHKCIVSDEKLGEMGEPFVFVHEGQEIKLCCKSCQKDFAKNPAKFLKKLPKSDQSTAAK
ncbi:MAG TPA: hypothetical protein VK633_04600 [Verrucomicrobiae bacterium]|nr:hypothetical protein [Verrucomicrobiae bacterium]